MRTLRTFRRDQSGGVSTEAAFVVTLMTLVTVGLIEAGWAVQQHSSAQAAVRHGARLAATLNPVSADLESRGVATAAFDITCDQDTRRCSQGGFRAAAMDRILFGPDGDAECGAKRSERRGMCDLYGGLDVSRVSVRYVSSGLAERNASYNPAPVITVSIAARPARTVLLGPLLPDHFTQLPGVSASLMGEDLDG